ncbi:DUF1415 domain-containing protein [Rivihabitans pingtungensis]|jgi:hypothetical protein|uniref:DUF1415 domain-containing protein n=1 Tax=Rivihabitans pingtungensis TaxID=1054498 RepID=A0A318KC92_9NEIS|nr:DUF1415 domain-containing protein [Rivihabitans pingtungensis]PXX73721.1 hypothetical protein DFR34_1371 [Rivihabitans pingtungensis]
MTTIHTPDDQTVIDATRIWLEKAVIGLNLCPFAKAVYVKNQIRYVVSHARHTDQFLEELDSELERLANTDPEEIDTTLLIHPTLFPEFSVFNDLLDLAETAPEALGLEGVLQVASFHPDFQFADTQPDDMSNYTNRSPYPTLHLIRESSIARAAESFPDPSVIFERNIEVVNELGPEGWKGLGIPYPQQGQEG